MVHVMVAMSFFDKNGNIRTSENFRLIAAIGAVLLWVKALGKVKGLNKSLALYIHSFTVMVLELRHFTIILIIVMLMFGNIYNLMIGPKYLEAHEEDLDEEYLKNAPFRSKWESLISLALMVMGVHERSWYTLPGNDIGTIFMQFTYLTFLFFVLIIVMNVSGENLLRLISY